MLDEDTFLTTLYVLVDDFFKTQPAPEQSGRPPSLTRSEVVTLGVFGQWARFESERGFYRYAQRHLRAAFPTLPSRPQLNRLWREQREAFVAFFRGLATRLHDSAAAYQILDGSGAATRNLKRRGRGWLPGLANVGWSNRLGWYQGFRVLVAIEPSGVITGFGFGSASSNDTALADSLLALRRFPDSRLTSVGDWCAQPYVADKGFVGARNLRHWRECYQATVISPPQRKSRHPWPKSRRRWLASIRQVVESIFNKLHHALRLDAERPHDLTGFQARLAAKMALHNFCIWLNQRYHRPNLAFANLIDW